MMKLALLLFATVALANPVADPLPDEPAPVSVPGDLVARQASCTVRGLGDRRDACLSAPSKSSNAKFISGIWNMPCQHLQ